MYILVHTYVDADGFSFSHVSLFVFHQKYKETKIFLRTSISFIIHTILAKGNNKIWTTRNKLTLVPHATQPWPRPQTGQNWITKTNSRLFCKENIGQTIL